MASAIGRALPGHQLGDEVVVRLPSGDRTYLVIDLAALLAHSPELGRSSTDANLPISRGIPAIVIGRGGEGGNTHAPEEWWRDVDSHVAVQRALLVLLAEVGLD